MIRNGTGDNRIMENKIRILVVHSTLHIGGAEEVTANLCSRIDKSKFDVKVCYLKEKGVVGEKIERQGTQVIGLSKKDNDKTDYFTSLKLRKIIKLYDIQLVHSHDVHAFTDCAICKITMPGLKFTHTFHFGNYPQRAQPFRLLERLLWRVPSKLISVSNKQQAGIRKLYGIPENRIMTLWNGVDIETQAAEFDIINHYRSLGKVLIGSINTLIEQKGMFDLLKVAVELKQRLPGKFVFVIAGDGHLKEPLKREIHSLGLENDVCLLGWVKDASKSFLPHIDIFFQPSLWEAMSMVLLEAMADGKAIVAAGVGETPFILNNNVSGIVVQPADINGMSNALESLVVDESLRQQYGMAAKQHYIESFTAKKMADRYETLYSLLLN